MIIYDTDGIPMAIIDDKKPKSLVSVTDMPDYIAIEYKRAKARCREYRAQGETCYVWPPKRYKSGLWGLPMINDVPPNLKDSEEYQWQV